jgi:hypothetical protein
VTLFRVDSGEHVTSVFPVLEDTTDDDNGEAADDVPPEDGPGDGTANEDSNDE